MKIILTGGGSGGHITPILAIADELKHLRTDVEIIYIGQKGDKLGELPSSHPNIDEVFNVRAGKFRRYHGQWWRNLFDIPLIFKNLRDMVWVIVGIWQSYRLLGKLKPDAIFIKGGFVGVPVGLAAAVRKIPYITHDSDVIPGLANRIIARWATLHTVAMPRHLYSYPANKTFEVGVPVSELYQPVTYRLMSEYRRGLGIKSDERVVCVTGGGLGSKRLNDSVATILPELLKKYPSLVFIHIAGRAHEAELNAYYDQHIPANQRNQVIVRGFVNDLHRYSAAADIIISRAGATHLAEFALQGKACIIVPNPLLTGGHQLKNAKELHKAKAIVLVSEDQLTSEPSVLLSQIRELLDHADKRKDLATNLAKFAKPEATTKLTDLILKVATKRLI